MRRLSPDRVAELVDRYEAGEEVMPLARRFGIDRVTVYHALANAGVERRRRRISEAERDEAVRLYERGMAIARIAARLGCSYTGAHALLKREGVPLRGRHYRGTKG